MLAVLRFNFAVPGLDPGALSAAYTAGIEMARHADAHGLDLVSLEEHHASGDGWSPAPLLNAAMILGATSQLRVIIQALLVPLYDPPRLAEELAVLDLASGGRLTIVAGLGYRPEEYTALGRDWKTRGRALDEALETLLAVWSGEPFEHEGRQVRLTPVPRRAPSALVWVGGGKPVSARRAARLGLPFCMPKNDPALAAYYTEQLAAHGTSGFVIMPPERTRLTFLADDPDRAWARLGHHFLHEARAYASWQQPGQTSAVRSHADTVDELRAEGVYEVLTPAECVERAQAAGPMDTMVLHPLVGGLPPADGWESLHLYTDKVLPALTAAAG
ncbi:luciferase [Frankia sp. CcI49]|uniref:LLM class flavin-dependent oxidoreductase n=1 Tax=Frankia sp. CcI49 TaxID=1745382 RepID=UPI000975C062|nr:LLM class flavin-dependent oxidoreductase [Frankia sp. CcI49]ONH62605.1 luciferase [Frankia sp. CcI49]